MSIGSWILKKNLRVLMERVSNGEEDIDKALENLVDLRESALEVDFVNGTFTKK